MVKLLNWIGVLSPSLFTADAISFEEKMSNMQNYLKELNTTFNTDQATEHSYRPALKILLESLENDIEAVNEPSRQRCGAPDFIVLKNDIPLGYIECKDIDISLDKELKRDQLKRYLESLPNLILTDYLEFRWFLNGELKQSARIGSVSDGKIKRDTQGLENLNMLFQAFLTTNTPVIGTTTELAMRMAKTAQLIRDAIEKAFEMDDKGGSLNHQMDTFRTTLMHDITKAKFADMYAQTICYGLFMARLSHQSGVFTREMASRYLPKSNPFLRKMFDEICGIDLDERIAWAVDNLVLLFNKADMSAVLKDFGKHTGRQNPVLHFYEDFLDAYDPELRRKLGVYYTPESVVSYIVRSVDKILKRDFKLEKGLADATKITIPNPKGEAKSVHKVQILDPAVGTGSFLHGVVSHIQQSFVGNEGMWQGYVDNDLLPRLFGFELQMAPYTIAHLMIGLLLKEYHYEFSDDKRLGIYLTNTLEESDKQIQESMRFGFADWLFNESTAASDVKADAPVMVVLGNPPYFGKSANKGKWIKKLIAPYFKVDGEKLGERNPKWLNDDYVKFIRFAQWRIEQTGYGVLAFITNHGYLDNPTFRGMRQNLMSTFDNIYLLDLHGNSKKKEKCPDGKNDENVFNIQQGVGIGIFIKKPQSGHKRHPATIHHADHFGVRSGKYQWLAENDVDSTKWETLEPISPFYLFKPRSMDRFDEYKNGWKITDVFPVNSVGIVTARDGLTIKDTENEVWQTVNEFTNCTPEEAREKFKLGKDSDWKIEWAQRDIKQSKMLKKSIVPILYRPFDIKHTYYTGTPSGFHTRPRANIMRHMLPGDNLGLVTVRQVAEGIFNHVFVSNTIVESRITLSNKGIASLYPLYLYPEGEPRRPNLSPEFLAELAAVIGFTPSPEQVFYYIYAVFHSPTYRSRYAEFLKMDFPRLPMPTDDALFNELCPLGEALVGCHLLERKLPELVKYPVAGNDIVERVVYSDKDRRVWINKTQYFEGVEPQVWEFQIGGYQVCHKWLKDRKNRTLSYEDKLHYPKVVEALAATIALMADIDIVCERLFE